jgi:hypothetical protein
MKHDWPDDDSQIETENINLLMKTLRTRLEDSADIFSTDLMIGFITNSLSLFNETPPFTCFSFGDTDFIQQFRDILVKGAILLMLSGKALIDVGFDSLPSIVDLMQTKWKVELNAHLEEIKTIKSNIATFAIWRR